MRFMVQLFFSLIFLLTACTENNSQNKVSVRLLEDPEHHINDSQEITKHDSTILYTGWYYIIDTNNGYKRILDKSTETYYLDRNPIVTAKNFTKLEIYETKGEKKYFGLSIRFDEEGTERWSLATEKSIGKKLAFILDNRLLYVPEVNSQITGGMSAINRGDYSKDELENFKNIIESEK